MWLFFGLVIGAFFFWLATRASIKLTWYEWILAVLSAVLALFAVDNYFASVVELEPRAAGLLLTIFGLPAVIFAGVDIVLVVLRRRKSAPATD